MNKKTLAKQLLDQSQTHYKNAAKLEADLREQNNLARHYWARYQQEMQKLNKKGNFNGTL